MKRTIIANATYWLTRLTSASAGNVLTEANLRGATKALEIVAGISEAWPTAIALTLALHSYMEQRGYWADWDNFLQILTVYARRQADLQSEATLLRLQSTIRRLRGRYQPAITSGRRAWRIIRQANTDSSDWAKMLSVLGDLYRLQSRFWRAQVLACRAVAWFNTYPDLIETAQAENRLGLVYFDQRQLDKAQPHLDRARHLYQEAGNLHGLAKALHNLGELHRRKNDEATALLYSQQAVQFYQTVGDEIHIARVQLNIGNIYRNRAELQTAELIYLKAESILKRIGDPSDLARVCHNLGMVYAGLGQWNEGEACFERALELWQRQDDRRNLANTWGEYASLYIAWGHRGQAQACMEAAWRLINDQPGSRYESLKRELAERQALLNKL